MPDDPQSSEANVDTLVWHDSIHRSHFNEELRVYLLAFEPTYDRSVVIPEFLKFCQKHDIVSYGLYEVFGPVDLLFKFWVPSDKRRRTDRAFVEWKTNISQNSKVWGTTIFDSDHCRYQSLWIDRSGTSQKVDDHLDLPSSVTELQNPDTIQRLLASNALRLRDNPPAIRFIVVISNDPSGPGRMSDLVRRDHMERIVQAVRDIEALRNVEIHEGGGSNWVLIDGTVEFGEYGCLAELQTKLGRTGILSFQCRTSTYLCVDNVEGVVERDAWRPNGADRTIERTPLIRSVEELLDLDESTDLEVKGSLRMNVFTYLSSGEVQPDKALEQKFLQTIAAFRNSEGGDLVIGALEPGRIPEKIRDAARSQFPEYGKYCLSGLDPDFFEKGWDHTHRHIRGIIAEHIGDAAATDVKIELVEIESRNIVRIHVPRNDYEDDEYLDRDVFPVRRGPSSVNLTGRERDKYREQRRRKKNR